MVKTLSKLFTKQVKTKLPTDSENQVEKRNLLVSDLGGLRNKLVSAFDKAVKKGVIHKNTAARKKQKINFFYRSFL